MRKRLVKRPVDIIDVLGTSDLRRAVSAGNRMGYRVTTKKVGKDGRYNEYIVKYWSKKS